MLGTVSIGNDAHHSCRWVGEDGFQRIPEVDNTKPAGRKDDETKCVRFVSGPEGFLFKAPTREHAPHEEGIGGHSLVIIADYSEEVPVMLRDRVWTGTGQIHKRVR